MLFVPKALAITNEPLTLDPFDLASGGAVLTRATQNDIPAANPALLPYGAKKLRWLGLRTAFYAGASSVTLAQELLKDSKTLQKQTNQDFLNLALDHPLHLGLAEILSFITSHFGLAFFANSQPDLKAWRNGDPATGAGTPEIVFHNESYGGVLASLAGRSPYDWLSFGLTAKYLLISQGVVDLDITDTNAVDEAKTELSEQDFTSPARGYGIDAGTLLFLQGRVVDFRLGLTADNIGGMRLSKPVTDGPTLSSYNVGVGFTLHGDADAVHFAVDYRDVTNAYEDPLFKRIYAGTKIVFHRILGLATGIYNGAPSYGLELDLFAIKLSFTEYTREYGDSPGVDPREIYIVSFALGTYF